MAGLIRWMLDHKVLILGSVTVCLFVSTVALATNCKGNNEEGSGMAVGASELNFSTADVELPIGFIPDNFYRLPRHVIPKNYELALHPDVSENTFHGTVNIKVEVLQQTETIILHSKKITINSIRLSSNNETAVVKSWDFTNDKREFLRVNLKNEISAGNYELRIKFAGRLDEGIIGFYASKLKNGG